VTTLAHAGGIPELLTVAVPLAIVVVLLRRSAKHRSDDENDRD
jgi:hypothetical protein